MNPFAVVAGIFFLIMVAKAAVTIPENRRGGVVRLGRYFKTLGPGLSFKIPFIDNVTLVDLDASIPGWQGLTEAELSAAVEHFVSVGSVTGEKFTRSRSAAPSVVTGGSASGTREEKALSAWLVRNASEQTGVDLSNDPMATNRIDESARGAIQELRSAGSCEINLPFITANQTGPKHFSCSMTMTQLEEIVGAARGV
jgi:regulator of protease activity HflC (stomatin/prohibitin superfamily)